MASKEKANGRILVVALKDTKKLDDILDQLDHTVVIMATNQKELKQVADKILNLQESQG